MPSHAVRGRANAGWESSDTTFFEASSWYSRVARSTKVTTSSQPRATVPATIQRTSHAELAVPKYVFAIAGAKARYATPATSTPPPTVRTTVRIIPRASSSFPRSSLGTSRIRVG